MSMLEFPIRRYPFTFVTVLCLIALGVAAFRSIPREEDPNFKISAFQITAIYPGAEPREVEQLVAKPIEDRLAELDDVYKIETTNWDGAAVIFIEFAANTDADRKYDDVTRELNALRPSLPHEIARLDVRRMSPGLVNIVQVALTSEDAPYSELEDAARDLKDLLKGLPGVHTAETWAYPPRELRVQLDSGRLNELGVQAGQVIEALQSENANVPAGAIDVGARSFALKSIGTFRSLEQVRATVVSAAGGRIVRVADVASVSWESQPLSYVGRYDGHRAVFVSANMRQGYNILAVNAAVDAALQRFGAQLPHRIRLERGFAQSVNVAERLKHLYRDFAIAIGLVLLTLLPLGLRAAGIVMVSIPLSLAFGLSVLYFLGYSLNQLSIAGFVVALGLLVDDSIVVTENIARHLRSGGAPGAAALQGVRQIAVAVLGCTAALIFAFLPLLALPGVPGKFIRVLPMTVVATIIGSLLVALLVIPFLASRLLRPDTDPHGNALLQRVMGAIHRYYQPALHACLARPRTTLAVSLGSSLLLGAAIVPLVGTSLFPRAETPQFLVTIETPDGSSLEATGAALAHVEGELAGLPEVKAWFANLGHGNPTVYYNVVAHENAVNYAEVFVQLRSYDTRRTPQLLEQLRARLATYPGAHLRVKEFVNGPYIKAPISVRILGPDLDTLRRLAAGVERVIAATPGTRDVDNALRVARTNLRLAVDTQRAGLLGVAAVDFERAVRLSVAGIPVGTFKAPSGEQYDIVVRTPVGARAGLETLDAVRVPSRSGAQLPLTQLATLEFENAPTLIERYDRQRAATVDAEVQQGYNTAKVTAQVVRRLERLQWPRGYRYELGGEAQSSAESFGGIGTAILVTIFGIFAVLVLEFGDFRSTLIVLTVVPLGVSGGLLMLLLTGNSISFTASIGFIALIGIEIKNSILFVDFANQLRESGVALQEAVERAGEMRFLPILLTSATAIGGLLPLALENAGIYSPMSWVIIGGLISSTLLARLVTPVMYQLIPPGGPGTLQPVAAGPVT